MKNENILVLGANGQDGGYLATAAAAAGAHVTAVDLGQKGPNLGQGVTFTSLDLTNTEALTALLVETRPQRIFHLAAAHGPDGTVLEDIWETALGVNVASLQACLDYARKQTETRITFASSSRVFGVNLEGDITEDSPQTPGDLYGVTKKMGGDLIRYYRMRHNVNAHAVYLFNHESRRRPPGYFIPRLVDALVNAVEGGAPRQMRTLDFYCDWGDAEEYAEFLLSLNEKAPQEDVILATGETWHGAALADKLFAHYGKRAGDHIEETGEGGGAAYRADTDKLKRLAGRTPQRDVFTLCLEMTEEKLAAKRG